MKTWAHGKALSRSGARVATDVTVLLSVLHEYLCA
jgi:hypothetical protein